MKTRIAFFGSHKISLPLLEFLLRSDIAQLSAIVSQPDRPSGRGLGIAQTEVSKFAERNSIPLLKPNVPDNATASWLKSIGCDLILVMAYGHILRENILAVPEKGIYNFHASILPKYRGASPIETAIACGETETGVSLMRVVEAMDAGEVADIGRVSINSTDNYETVSKKIATASPILLSRNLMELCGGTLQFVEQDHALATFTRKLSKADGQLNFYQPAELLSNKIRALTPHIGCEINLCGTALKIGSASVEATNCTEFAPGEVVAIESMAMKIATADGLLAIHELQRPGGRMLKVGDFANGFPIKIGEVFESRSGPAFSFDKPYCSPK
jgi:methionyl-tRNA formyltransferase